jgi:hypothetical protein
MTGITSPQEPTISPDIVYLEEKCPDLIAVAKTELLDKLDIISQRDVLGSDGCCESWEEIIKLLTAIEVYEENDIPVLSNGAGGYTTYPTKVNRQLTMCICKFLGFKSK